MADVFKYSDPKRPLYFTAGWVLGNFSIYRALAMSKDVNGDVAKLRDAVAKHQFEGAVNDDGSLTYGGVTAHWRTMDKV